VQALSHIDNRRSLSPRRETVAEESPDLAIVSRSVLPAFSRAEFARWNARSGRPREANRGPHRAPIDRSV
jgi:hypothetical protein